MRLRSTDPGGTQQAGGPSDPRSRGAERWASPLRLLRVHPEWALSPLLLICVIVAWGMGVQVFKVEPTVVPGPSATWNALVYGFAKDPSASDGFYRHISVTLFEALAGFGLGSLGGLLLALLVSQNRLVERTLMPYLTAFQALPKIALAPLFLLWFGLGLSSKVYFVGTVTFFPVLINAIAGFASVETNPLLLMKSYKATWFQNLRYLVLPQALPFIFAGLEVALLFSVTAAIVAEFVGGQDGLGAFLLQKQYTVDIPTVFADLVILSILGVILDLIMRAVRRRVIFWAPELTRAVEA